MLRRDGLNRYLDDLLETARFDDYAPNGLQVEGAEHLSTLVPGVTARRALVDAALQAGAAALLVHHGYFWRGEAPRIVGMNRTRIARRRRLCAAHTVCRLVYRRRGEMARACRRGRARRIHHLRNFRAQRACGARAGYSFVRGGAPRH